MTEQLSSNVETATTTTVEEKQTTSKESSASENLPVRIKLKKPKSEKKVNWTAETIDNENMNKKKSKCCCVYVKPREFDESSSDTDDECQHCRGHVEIKQKSENVQLKEQDEKENNIIPSKDSNEN